MTAGGSVPLLYQRGCVGSGHTAVPCCRVVGYVCVCVCVRSFSDVHRSHSSCTMSPCFCFVCAFGERRVGGDRVKSTCAPHCVGSRPLVCFPPSPPPLWGACARDDTLLRVLFVCVTCGMVWGGGFLVFLIPRATSTSQTGKGWWWHAMAPHQKSRVNTHAHVPGPLVALLLLVGVSCGTWPPSRSLGRFDGHPDSTSGILEAISPDSGAPEAAVNFSPLQ